MSRYQVFARRIRELVTVSSVLLAILANGSPVAAQGGGLLSAVETDIDATSDVVKDFTLLDGVVLSGTVRSTTGQPIFGGTVLATSESRRHGGPIQFNPVGGGSTYRIILAPGTYSLTAQIVQLDSATSSIATVTFDVMSGLNITGNRTLDITVTPLPTFPVNGRVSSAGSLPTKGTIQFIAEDARVTAAVEFDGSYRIALPAGSYNVFVYIFLNDQTVNLGLLLTTASISGATTKDLTLPVVFNVSGTIKTHTGAVAAPSSFTAVDPIQAPPNTTSGTATIPSSSSTGAFSLPLPGGSYNTSSTIGINFGGNARGTLGFNNTPTVLAIDVDTTVNVVASAPPSAVTISGKVTDSRGRAVAGVLISAITNSITGIQAGSFSAFTMTAADGSYSVKALSGTGYTILVAPRNP